MQGFVQNALPESGLERVAKHKIDPASEEALLERLEVYVGVEALCVELDYEVEIAGFPCRAPGR
jgi:hypothetical protein